MAKNDLARLQVILEAESSRLTKGLDKVDARMKRWERKSKKSISNVGSAFAGVISIAAIANISNQIKEAAAKFEILDASLRTVTGSAEAFGSAKKTIDAFVGEVPTTLEEATRSFIKLKALGLDPSREAMVSYSNTALAMGLSLNQMVEAVADATTGEFERLKEFGIKSRTIGENVSFTFQGITTTVQKNAEEIEGYLRSIGDVQFAGAAAAQMDTIKGRSLQLQTAIDKLFVALGDAGLTKVFKDSLEQMTKWVQKIEDSKESLEGVVAVVKFASKVFETIIVIFKEVGSAIGQIAASVEALIDLDFKRFNFIQKHATKERAENWKTAESIWAKVEAQEELNKKTAAIPGAAAPGAAPGGDQEEQRDKELQKFRGSLLSQLESLETHLMNREEREMFAFERRQEMLEESLEAGLISEERFHFLSEELEEKHLDRLSKLREKDMTKAERLWAMGWKGKMQLAQTGLRGLSNLMQSESKKQFAIGKAAAISDTIINTYRAAQSGFATQPFFPVGLAMGALAIVQGINNVNKIRSQQFGAGSVSGGAATPTYNANPNTGIPTEAPGFDELRDQGEPGQVININIHGNPTKDQVRELIDSINEEIGDGVELRTA